VRLDFGRSFYFQNTVMELIGERLPVTLKLGGIALLLAVIVAIPLGVLGRDLPRQLGSIGSRCWSRWSGRRCPTSGRAEPDPGVLGRLKWLPVAGNTSWQHFVLPTVALGYYAMPSLMRLTRAGMLDVLALRLHPHRARQGPEPGACGVQARAAQRDHPVMALAAVELGFMLGGSVVIESVYSLQGLGQLAWDSISRNDYPVVQAVVLIIAGVLHRPDLRRRRAQRGARPAHAHALRPQDVVHISFRFVDLADAARVAPRLAAQPGSSRAGARQRDPGLDRARRAVRALAQPARPVCARSDAAPDPAGLVRQGQLGAFARHRQARPRLLQPVALRRSCVASSSVSRRR